MIKNKRFKYKERSKIRPTGDHLANKKKKTKKSVKKSKKGKRKVKTPKKPPLKPKKKKLVSKKSKKVRVKKPKAVKGKSRVKKKFLKKKMPAKKKAPKIKKPKKKSVIIKKKEVKTKKTKKKVKEIEVGLTPEEIRQVSEILSKPIIRHMLVDLGGENAIAIVRNFSTGASDEDIAKKLKLKISDVRAALNRLHSQGIVAYNRRKDSDTGWYSYSWYLNKGKMEKWAINQLSKFEGQCEEGTDYYVCPSCGGSAIFEFDEALDKNFRCEICNNALEFVDERKKEELGLTMHLRKGF